MGAERAGTLNLGELSLSGNSIGGDRGAAPLRERRPARLGSAGPLNTGLTDTGALLLVDQAAAEVAAPQHAGGHACGAGSPADTGLGRSPAAGSPRHMGRPLTALQGTQSILVRRVRLLSRNADDTHHG